MANKAVDKPFRELHETLTEWSCGYCKHVAITIRQGVAVCPQHKDLWTVGNLEYRKLGIKAADHQPYDTFLEQSPR